MNTSCPSRNVLKDFNDGRINDGRSVDRIAEHLGTCEKCLVTLEGLEADPLAKGLQKSLSITPQDDKTFTDSSYDEESDSFQQALARLTPSTASLRLGPSDSLAEQRYNILAFIGEGSFGRTFLGRSDPEDLMAVKIFNPEQLVSKLHRKQFIVDCERASRLQHPNIHPLVEYGFWDEARMFYSSRYLESPTLTEIARSSNGISFDSAMTIFLQTCNALQHAHGVEVIHRHLNPDNILIENWDSEGELETLVTGFGFTFDSRYQFELLEPKSMKTPFDSPESNNNDAKFIDPRADVYSLGKILKLLLRIARPGREHITDRLNEIVAKSTASRRRGRYTSVDELLTVLAAT